MFLPNRKQISGERHITASNRDNGHFFNCETNGDFTAELRVRAQYDELYDQAGIMVRIDDAHWVKAGIEMSDGKALLSSVLTVGQSDWATGVYGHDPADFRMRATVAGGVLRLQVSADGLRWRLTRLSPFPRAASYAVGPMIALPSGPPESAVFRFSRWAALEQGIT